MNKKNKFYMFFTMFLFLFSLMMFSMPSTITGGMEVQDSIKWNTPKNEKIKMILDVDTGIDDAMALAYAIGNPKIDLIGITTVYGNVSRNQSIKNTKKLLKLLGREDIPIYAGSDRPLNHKNAYAPSKYTKKVHGENGLGDVELPYDETEVDDKSALGFIKESIEKYEDKLYLVALGPESNLSKLIDVNPGLGDNIGEIVVMGGALTVEGNVSKFAEANIYNDPVAANKFFRSGTPFTMIGLDVTLKTLLTKKTTEEWRRLGTLPGEEFADIVDFYIDFYETNGFKGSGLHDPVAIIAAIHPEFFDFNELPMKVDTTDTGWGRTVAITKKLNNSKAKTAKVATDINVKKVMEEFKGTLLKLFSDE